MCGCNSPSLQNTMLMTLIMHFRENVDDGMFHLLICSSELYQRLLVPNGTFICFFCFARVYCFVWVVKSRVIQCAVFLVGFCYRLFISQELMFSASLFLLLSFCFFSFLLYFFDVVPIWHTAMECLRIMFCHTFYCFSYILSFMLHLNVSRFMVCACLLYRFLSRNKENVSYFYTCNVAYELLNFRADRIHKHENFDRSPIYFITTHQNLLRVWQFSIGFLDEIGRNLLHCRRYQHRLFFMSGNGHEFTVRVMGFSSSIKINCQNILTTFS